MSNESNAIFYSISPIKDMKTLEQEKRVSYKLNDDTIAPIYIFKMPDFFNTKDYGKGVKQIFYQEFCLIEEHKDPPS